MKKILYIFAAFIFMTSCEDDPVVTIPDTRIYQVLNKDGVTIPVTTEDNRDGSGFLIGNLLFENTETRFTADLDYVNDDKTNFKLNILGDQSNFTFVSGTGNFTSDSIFISIFREVIGIDVEETYVGSR